MRKCPEELRLQKYAKQTYQETFNRYVREYDCSNRKKQESDNSKRFDISIPLGSTDMQLGKQMIAEFREGKMLSMLSTLEIIKNVFPIILEEDNVVSIDIPVTETHRIIIVGDIHGQIEDLLLIIQKYGFPSALTRFLFNGDIVDRGQNSCECILLILALKLLAPKHVHINRGNHEARGINENGGFEKEVLKKI